MAKVKEMRITLGRTLSDDNYGSIKVEVSETIEVGDTPHDEAYSQLRRRVSKKFKSLKEQAMRSIQ